MSFGTFAGNKVPESRVRSIVLATLAGAVVGMPLGAHAQDFIENDLLHDLRVDIASGTPAVSADARSQRWQLNANGVDLRRTGRISEWTDWKQSWRPEPRSTDAHWAAAVSGNWSDPSRWTSSPSYPNNGNPPGSVYNVFLDAVGSNHVVTLDMNVDVQSLVINSASTELVHNPLQRLSAAGSIDLVAGTYKLNGGELADSTLNLLGGEFLVNGATMSVFRNMSVSGDWLLDNWIEVHSDLAVNGTVRMNNNGFMLMGSQTIESGTFNFDGPGINSFAIRSTGGLPTLTLAPGVVVHGGNGRLGSLNANYVDGLVNQGVISADVADMTMRIETDEFLNEGLVEARNGALLYIGGDEKNGRITGWSNTGVLRADGGWLRLGGQAATADFGTIENINGGNVILSGTFDNSNTVLNIDSPGGEWWQYGTISGGTIDVASGTRMRLAGNLDGVVLNGTVESQSVTIKNGLTLDGTIRLVEQFANITFDGTQTLDGGTITFGGLSGYKQLYMTNDTTLTIGAGTTLLGGSGRVGAGASSGNATHLVNEGLIRSDVTGANFSIAPKTFDNYGVVEVVDGATLTIGKSTVNQTTTRNYGLFDVSGGLLDIGGTFSQVGGTLQQTGGQIQLSGTLQNSLSSFTLDGPNAQFMFDGTIVGGTINILNGAQFALGDRDMGVLNGVVLNGPVEVRGGSAVDTILDIVNGIDLNGSIDVSGEKALVRFFDTPTLDRGSIVFNGDLVSEQELQIGDGQTLALGANVTISGGGATLAKSFNGQPTVLTNDGLIRSDRPGTSLSILADSFTNTGVIEAAAGTSLFVGPGSWSNTGTLRANGGRLVLRGAFESSNLLGLENNGGNVWLDGELDNIGSTLTLNSITGGLELEGGRITGGTIVQSEGAELGLALVPGWGHSRGWLEDVSLVGDLHMPFVGGEWTILGDFSLEGDVVIEGRDNLIDFNRRELDNLTVHFNGSGLEHDQIRGADFGTGAVVRGGRGGIGDIEYNKGHIIADVPNTSLSVGGGNRFVNEGTIEVLKDSGMAIFFNSGWSNPGNIKVNEGALSVGGAFSSKVFENMERIGGDVRIYNADVDNSERNWTLHPGPWTILNGSNIKGGSIIVGPLSSLSIGGGNTTSLSGVAINGDLQMSEEDTTLWVKGDLDLMGTLSMIAPSTNLHFSHDGTLLNGTVFFDGTLPGERKIRAINDTTFTIGSPSIIHGGEGEIFTGPSSTVINQGLISADVLDQSITITTKRFDNQGTLEAINGGELILIESPDQIGPMPAAFLHNAGTLNLGGDTQLVVGGFLQEPGGVIAMDASSRGGIVNASSLFVSAPAWLAGTLEVEMFGAPKFGDEFKLFGWTEVNGEFDRVLLPQLSGTLVWDSSSLYQTGVIGVVPSPGSVSLLAVGGAVFAFGRKRRSAERGEL